MIGWGYFYETVKVVQACVSGTGVLIIISGVVLALYKYLKIVMAGKATSQGVMINAIRLDMGRILILGLEFIVAADLIGTTTTPDYYEVGMLAIIVVIRTMLSYSINKELMMIRKE